MNYLKIVDQHGRRIPVSEYMAAYEAAGTGRRLATWGLSNFGPNTALLGSLASLRSRSRHLSMNNSLASGAIDSFVANMIGQGITPRWQLEDRELKEKIQELWSDSVSELDAAGVSNFYGQQSQVAHALIEGGECFSRLHPRPVSRGLAVPLQVQLFEGDHLDAGYNTLAPNGNEIRMGIEFDKNWRRTAYWFYENHPGEQFLTADNTSKKRILSRHIQHIYRVLRPGQIRGRPWLTPVIVELHEIDQCTDAELVRRKTTAMFGGFITNTQPAHGQPPIGRPGASDASGNKVIELEPGTFPELPWGMDVKFSTPTDVGGNYVAWMVQQLRSVARGIGITYEQLTGDLTGVNYSSIRAGLLEFRRLCMMIVAQTIVFQFCRPVINAWLDTAVLVGTLDIPDYIRNRRKYQRIDWMPDGWDWVDPVKDQKADMMEIRNGLTSRARKVAERGGDVEVIDKEIAADNARADELGLVFDTDPRKVASSGAHQDKDEKEDENE